MIYKMTLTGDFGRTFFFDGVKYVHKDHFGETGLKDTTTLFVTIFQHNKTEPLGKATLYITAPNFARQLATMEITNTNSKLEKLKWVARFSEFFPKLYGMFMTQLHLVTSISTMTCHPGRKGP